MAISESFNGAPKRRRRKSAAQAQGDDADGVTISVPMDGSDPSLGQPMPAFDPNDAEAVSITVGDDGSVDLDFDPDLGTNDNSPSKHEDNLAERLPEGELARIAGYLLEAIQADDRSRSDWIEQRSEGLDLLGLKVERPKGGVGTSAAPLDGMSTVRDPLMLEAVLRFQANAFGELCPAGGPVKAVNFGDEDANNDMLAEQLESDFNFYLTTGAPEYYPDTRKMLFWTGYASGMFKKVYKCPIRRRPVSESVDGADLILPPDATDLKNAGRITHQISMRRATMRRMQILGVYRDVPLTMPTPEPNALARKEADIQGLQINQQRQEDQDYTVYECYCELDIEGFEHKEGNEVTGLPLPYRVTLDKDSQTILEIRRNWEEDDEDFQSKIPFVAFPYATGFGVYGMGLLHILGNVTLALTTMLRESIDAGMFASFPGFIFAKQAGRQLQNEFRVAPGGGVPFDTGNKPLSDCIMPLPYKDLSGAMPTLMQQLREVGSRVGGTAETPVGEGKQDAPVGTTLAMIEQATKIEGGVHKALHAAQAEEFGLLKKLFQEDPESLWRGNRRPALGGTMQIRVAKFQQALENCELVPMADPNTPSHMHRVMKALAIKQLQAASPQLYDPMAVDRRILSMIHVDNPEDLFAPPQTQQQGPDPAALSMMAQLQLKQQDTAVKAQGLQLQQAKLIAEARDKDADRKSKETIETMKIAQALAVHPDANPIVDQQLIQMAPFLHPSPPGGLAPDRGAIPPAPSGAPPTPGQPPMSAGGTVPPEPPQPPARDDGLDVAMQAVELAMGLHNKMQQSPQYAPLQYPGSFNNNPRRWWN